MTSLCTRLLRATRRSSLQLNPSSFLTKINMLDVVFVPGGVKHAASSVSARAAASTSR